MARVVNLNPREMAPNSGDRILISRNPSSGKFDTIRWCGTEVAYDPDRGPLEQALQLAQKDAETFNIRTIYVQEAANADWT